MPRYGKWLTITYPVYLHVWHEYKYGKLHRHTDTGRHDKILTNTHKQNVVARSVVSNMVFDSNNY